MGRPKGRLAHPDGDTLLEHLVHSASRYPTILVGRAEAYTDLVTDVPRIPDVASGIGPIAGIAAALDHARSRYVITIACDMPHLDAATIQALAEDPRDTAVLSARADDDAPWEPMLTRWSVPAMRDVVHAAIDRGEHGLQRLIAAQSPVPFVPRDPDVLVDWDTPEDVGR